MEEKKFLVVGDIDHISGYLRYAHFEMYLTAEEHQKFDTLSDEEQIQWLKEDGEIIVDDFEVNDIGDISNIEY